MRRPPYRSWYRVSFYPANSTLLIGDFQYLPDTQHIARKAVQLFDGIHGSIIPSGEKPKGIPCTDSILDIARCLAGRDFQYLANIQHVAGKIVQPFDGVYGSTVSLGNEPKAVSGLDNIGDSSRLRIRGGNVLSDTKIGII